jgi:excisionase family DNA binding protein
MMSRSQGSQGAVRIQGAPKVAQSTKQAAPAAPALPVLLTLEDVAEYTGRAESSVRDWIYRGELKARKLGKRLCIYEHELREFIERLPTVAVSTKHRAQLVRTNPSNAEGDDHGSSL